MSFERVAPPAWPTGGTDPGELRRAIDGWVRSEAIAALVACFGGTPPSGTADEALRQLTLFSDTWDYRRGNLERGEIEAIDYADEIDEIVCGAALALGLSGRATPTHDRYDHVLILGGGPRTALARTDFAATLLHGKVECASVAALASLRPLGPGEITFAEKHGMPDARYLRDESDAMAAGLVRALEVEGPPERRHGTSPWGTPWNVREFAAAGRVLTVLAAPSSDPDRRANTADTLTGWSTLVSTPKPSDRVLVVTTDLYVPFQHADAVRLIGLPLRCGIETVGLDTPGYSQWLPPSTHTAILQEVRSTVLAMSRLAEACARSHR